MEIITDNLGVVQYIETELKSIAKDDKKRRAMLREELIKLAGIEKGRAVMRDNYVPHADAVRIFKSHGLWP